MTGIAVVGLATTHPYADARTLARTCPEVRFHLVEPDGGAAARFVAEHPGTIVHENPGSLPATEIDGVVLTVRPPRVAEVLGMLGDVAAPVFVNKPAAVTSGQARAVAAAVEAHRAPVFGTSVLRFAPVWQEFRARLERREVLSLDVMLRHDVGHWATGSDRAWQADPRVGGGLAGTVGIHGLELLVSLVGTQVRLLHAAARNRARGGTAGTDVLVMTLDCDGIPATVHCLGAAAEEEYRVVARTSAGEMACRLPGEGPDPFGYEATVGAFLDLCRRGGEAPVPMAQTQAVASLIGETNRALEGCEENAREACGAGPIPPPGTVRRCPTGGRKTPDGSDRG